jgi:protein associated with RNAse G/E
MIRAGAEIRVEVYKADGSWYRRWHATIESVDPDSIITVSPPGGLVEDKHRGNWNTKNILRAYYWFDKPYNLVEVFKPDGRLEELYVNVASPAEIKDGILRFTDYELDVARILPSVAKILDREEFDEAAQKYGYSEDFQRQAYQTAELVVQLVDHWPAKSAPKFGE